MYNFFYQYLLKVFDTPHPTFEPGAKITHLNKQIISKAISVPKNSHRSQDQLSAL